MINLNSVLNNSASLEVHAHWDPIADSTYNLHKNSPENTELFDLSPNEPVREYRGDAFNAFLPSLSVAVGDVWELDMESVIPFLSQFHPGATGELRHGQKGAFACLRALSPDYADITFRIHAEFTLATRPVPESERRDDEDPVERARFIPSQYAGQLLVNLNTGVVCDFSLALPPRNSNVDINDFGYVARLSLIYRWVKEKRRDRLTCLQAALNCRQKGFHTKLLPPSGIFHPVTQDKSGIHSRAGRSLN